ncbi:hypothetical protein NDU88_001060, partial [Pleurodeles waltl]
MFFISSVRGRAEVQGLPVSSTRPWTDRLTPRRSYRCCEVCNCRTPYFKSTTGDKKLFRGMGLHTPLLDL